jgi:glycosyltransferase involved in cell wall biosynthesis
MNIAIFTNNYLPNPYGVSTSVDGFRRAMMRRGHTVYVFAPRWSRTSSHEDDAHIFRYPAIKAPTKIEFFLVVPYASDIDAVIEQLTFDVIHAQHSNLLGASARRWAQKKDVPLIFTWHSLYDRYAHYLPFVPEHISGRIAMKNAADYANESDHVIVPTASVIPIIQKAGVAHDRISVVPSGVDEGLFIEPDGSLVRKKWHIRDDRIVLTTVSRLTEEKNVLFLMKQVAGVLRDDPRVVFLCVGEGDLMGEMQEICRVYGVENQVIFAGKVERERVKDHLAAGDLFVYASTSETQGTIITENMYVGRAVVAIDATGISDIVTADVGIKTPENTEFQKAIKNMINDDALREKMGNNAYVKAREEYTTDVCTEKLLDVYHEVIEQYQNTV